MMFWRLVGSLILIIKRSMKQHSQDFFTPRFVRKFAIAYKTA